MRAASVLFHDPDGNRLEYICMLPDPPRPDAGVVPWSEWKGFREDRSCGPDLSGVTSVQRLFETHISIRNLQRSVTFYPDAVGLETGLIQSQSSVGMGGAFLGRRAWSVNDGRLVFRCPLAPHKLATSCCLSTK